MLTDEQLYIIKLIRLSFDKDINGFELTDSLDKENVASIISSNSILPTVFDCLPNDLIGKLQGKYHSILHHSVLQDYYGTQVLVALEEAGFDCIALKGWVMRNYYRDQSKRQMGDIDILVKPYDYKAIKLVMEKLGFSSEKESSWMHDNFAFRNVLVEMHKRLTDDSGVIQTWENEMWQRVSRVNGHECAMSQEDFFIFHIIHMHKDFLNGSLGLRRIIDTWLLTNQDMDMQFVRNELKKMGIDVFCERMICLSKACMGEMEITEDMEILLRHSFQHGIYGTDVSYKTGRIVAMGDTLKKGKMRSLTSAVFLPYKRMKAQFPVLEKCPILLPLCWCKRNIRLMGFALKNKNMLNYSNISEKEYEEMREFFRAGGCL